MTVLLRVAASVILLVLGGVFIYGFGAGYFWSMGLSLPSPWNVVAAGLLAAGLLWLIARILKGSPRQ